MSRLLESVARWLSFALIFSLPLVAVPSALDPLEIHKQTVLVALTLCAFLAWSCAMVSRRAVSLRAGWIHVVPWFVVAATVAAVLAVTLIAAVGLVRAQVDECTDEDYGYFGEE